MYRGGATIGVMPGQEDHPAAEQALRLRRLGAAAKTAAQTAEDAREARDAAIEEASFSYSTRWIARHTGLSPSAVHDIVIRRTAARQAALARAAGL